MNRWISVIVIFIGGIVAGMALSSVLGGTPLKDYLPPLTTLFAAYIGLRSAFALEEHRRADQRARDVAEKAAERISAGKRAIFVLSQFLNRMVVLQQQLISPFRGNPGAFIEMPPYHAAELPFRLDLDSISFLLDSSQPNVLAEIATAYDYYAAATAIIDRRSYFHAEEVQPKLESAAVQTATLQSIEILLGPRLHKTLVDMTADTITLTDGAVEKLQGACNSLRGCLVEMFPEAQRLPRVEIPAASPQE